jgi:tetratricopeptide (TPR) repeat protein
VTTREPNFAPAFAALGRTYVHMAEFHNQRADLLASANNALRAALQFDPRNLDALSTDLHVATVKRNWQRAEQDAALLRAINPHNVFTLRGLAHYYGALAFPDQQTVALREATKLDPLSFVDLNNLASVYNEAGRYADAAAAASDALKLKPDRPLSLYSLCWAYAGMKDVERSRSLSVELQGLNAADGADACTLRAAAAARNFKEAHRLADALAGRFPSFIFSETDIGYFYALAGDFTDAVSWLSRAYGREDAGLFSLAYAPTTPSGLLRTPGWKALMARPDARRWEAAHDRVAADLAGN